MASCHFFVDDTEIIQGVRLKDVAYHARGANHDTIGIEMAGTASQTEEQWQDQYSLSVIANTIDLCVRLCWRLSIVPRILGVEDLLNEDRGITTHHVVSLAYRRSTHTDPGPGFPFLQVVSEIAKRYDALVAGR